MAMTINVAGWCFTMTGSYPEIHITLSSHALLICNKLNQ